MHLNHTLEETESVACTDLKILYGSMMAELKQVEGGRPGRLYFLKLWSSVAPTGNVYRHNALAAERLKHCEDLWNQIDELVSKQGDELTAARSITDLHQAITEVPSPIYPVTRASSSCAPCVPARQGSMDEVVASEEGGHKGFRPLEEFLHTKTWRIGPLLLPSDRRQMMNRIYCIAAAWLVFWMQITAPLFIFWNQQGNLPPSVKERIKDFDLHEMLCLGTSVSERLHTLMGIGLLALLLLILSNYINSQLDDVDKSRHLPLDRFWLFIGNLANIWCTVMTAMAAVVLFWNEDTPTSMSMDALTLLWIFTLDDFCSYAFHILNQTDEDFQRSAAWTKVLRPAKI